MKRVTHAVLLGALALVMAGSSIGCKSIKGITDALSNLKKLQFKLGDVNGFKLSGIDVGNAAQKSQLSATDLLRLSTSIAQRKLPVDFTLNVLARNPNDGAGTSTSTPLYLRKLAWTLLIDERTTINGVVDQRLEIPGSGQTTTIPLTISLDLYKFFADKGLDDMVNLALAIGGAQGSSSRLKLTAKASVETPLGVIDYPGELTIVNTQFTNP